MILIRLGKVLLFFISILLVVLLFFGDQLANIFVFQHWRPYPQSDNRPIEGTYTDSFIKLGHDSIHFQLFSVDKPVGTLIYFHGNRGNLEKWGPIGQALTKYGYNVIVWDYPGYGKSSGDSDFDNFLSVTTSVFSEFLKQDTTGNIVIYGRSLGTGAAMSLTGHHNIKRIILETPYTNMKDVIKYHTWVLQKFVTKNIDNQIEMENCPVPVLILHGTGDKVIPYHMSQILIRNCKHSACQFVSIPGGGHNNLHEYKITNEAIASFLNYE